MPSSNSALVDACSPASCTREPNSFAMRCTYSWRITDSGSRNFCADQETILSALDNSAARIDADLAAFFDPSGQVIATTLPGLPDASAMRWPRWVRPLTIPASSIEASTTSPICW